MSNDIEIKISDAHTMIDELHVQTIFPLLENPNPGKKHIAATNKSSTQHL